MADRYLTGVQYSVRLALSIAEAAASVGISERLMRRLMPEIPHCRIGNRVVIPVALLAEWLRRKAKEEQSVVGKAVNDIMEDIQSHR
jgi:hypothetical protein